MKRLIKMSVILVIVLVGMNVFLQNKVEAETVSEIVKEITPSDVESNNYSSLQEVIGKILGFLQIASGLTTVVMVAFLGFKLLTETPDVKSEVKHRLFPIVIGIVVVFGTISISRFIIGIVT